MNHTIFKFIFIKALRLFAANRNFNRLKNIRRTVNFYVAIVTLNDEVRGAFGIFGGDATCDKFFIDQNQNAGRVDAVKAAIGGKVQCCKRLNRAECRRTFRG